MTLKRVLILVVLIAAGMITVFGLLRSAPPSVPFGRVTREDLVSTLITNGQVRPIRAAEIRAESTGRVADVMGEPGQQVSAGEALLRIDARDASSQLAEARAALESAQERLQQVESGGAPRNRAELESSLIETRMKLAAAQREVEVLRRLVEQKAATPSELRQQEDQAAELTAKAKSIERQLQLLVAPADRAEAVAAVTTAKLTLSEAERAAALRVVRSPIAGTLFEFSPILGAWLNPGDPIGKVGDLSRVRVSVYVDEPELGRVERGLPVTIRWDAYPERTWKGEVDQLPARIESFGTRLVGEVLCLIDNPDHGLLPGTNVTAEIVTAKTQQALVIPKQALRRRLGVDGVWLFEGSQIRWQEVTLGVTSLTAVEVKSGLTEGQSVALIYDGELRDGMEVNPVYP